MCVLPLSPSICLPRLTESPSTCLPRLTECLSRIFSRLNLLLLNSKCAAKNTSNKPHPPTCYYGYELPHNGVNFVQESAWVLQLRCASVHGSEQAVSSISCLCEPALCVQSCLLLDSEAFAELGEAEISDDESFGSPQAVTGDRETHRDCLIDGQCKPPSSDRPDTGITRDAKGPPKFMSDYNVN